jgi:hypothetical protein
MNVTATCEFNIAGLFHTNTLASCRKTTYTSSSIDLEDTSFRKGVSLTAACSTDGIRRFRSYT